MFRVNRLFRAGMVTLFTMVLAVSFFGFSTAVAAPAPKDVNWKMVVYPASLNEVSAKTYLQMAKSVSERTKGAFKITIFPSGQLGYSAAEHQKVTTQNLVQMSEAMAGGVQGAPGFLVFSYGAVFKNMQDADKAWTAIEPDMKKIAATFNCGILSQQVRGIATIHTTKKPIPTVDSFKGEKFRAWNSMAAAMFSAVGAVPQSIPYAERYTALATNIVLGNTASNSTQIDSKDYEVCKYTNLWPCDSTLMVGLVNLDAYNALPKEYQTILSEEMEKAGKDGFAQYSALDKQALKVLTERGVTIVQPSESEIDKWMKIHQGLHEKLKTAAGQQAIDTYAKIKAVLGY